VTVKGWLDVPADRLEAVRAATDEHSRRTRAEAGCLLFEMAEDPSIPGRFLIDEEFIDETALQAHRDRKAGTEWDRVTDGLPRNLTHSGLPG